MVLLLSAPAMAATKVGKHMILFEPGGGQMVVNETYLCSNDGKTTGTIRHGTAHSTCRRRPTAK